MGWTKVSLILYLVSLNAFLFVNLSEASKPKPIPYSQPFNRTSFPKGFVFGAGTAAYQSEGAAFSDGKGLNIWDTFTRQQPGKIANRSNGDIANDFYHRYKEDIKLMKKVGSFRFSISWSRILPKGKLSGGVNQLGVKFYNNLINELLANGIKPAVTLFHFDTPQALEDEYKSWLSHNIVKDFSDYANFCFQTFGDRVKFWVTLNEPNGLALNAYNFGIAAPGRCSSYVGNCTARNSATEPYIATHNLLLSHATAVKLYREKYQAHQKGKIGISIVTHWFAHPITYGHYPKSMRSTVGDRLPKFTAEESKLVKGSMDFLGLNYYTTNYAKAASLTGGLNKSYSGDRSINLSSERKGIPTGTPTALSWLFIYPKGLWHLLSHIKEKYTKPIIYITENGMADKGSLSVSEGIKDSLRISYHNGHLSYLLKAIEDGVRVKGYYLWTFWDDFEWDADFTARFGITYIDYKNNLKRHLKNSAYWFKKFLLN